MKKLALTTVCALAMAGAAFAQGNVTWTSIGAAGFTAQTNAVTYSPLFGGGASGLGGATIGNTSAAANGFDYELLYLGGASVAAPTTVTSLLGWSDAGLGGLNSASAGRAQVIASESTTAATVPWAAGTTDNIVLVGWSANLGLLGSGLETWQNVSNVLANWNTGGQFAPAGGQQYFFGISNPGYLAPSAANPGSTVVGGGASINGTPIQSTLTPLYLLPVPEPTSLALAGLGGLALMAFRRQRK